MSETIENVGRELPRLDTLKAAAAPAGGFIIVDDKGDQWREAAYGSFEQAALVAEIWSLIADSVAEARNLVCSLEHNEGDFDRLARFRDNLKDLPGIICGAHP